MSQYRVTVDGVAYVVEVEELAGGAPVVVAAPTPAAAPKPASPATPVKPAAPVVAAPAPVAAGATTVTAPMPGKVLDVKVAVGATVKNGELVLLLEAMKMENEIFASADGTVSEVRVRGGDSVNTGDVLLVIG